MQLEVDFKSNLSFSWRPKPFKKFAVNTFSVLPHLKADHFMVLQIFEF